MFATVQICWYKPAYSSQFKNCGKFIANTFFYSQIIDVKFFQLSQVQRHKSCGKFVGNNYCSQFWYNLP